MTDTIILDHGAGGTLSRDLITDLIVPALGDRHLGALQDSAVLDVPSRRLALTTDSFVVDPVFFTGGDIGKIAVCGTVNDLAVSGAEPRYLTLSLILETGFPLTDLHTIVCSAAEAAREAGVFIVAGDTKVVDKGAADKIFINTAGIGVFGAAAVALTPERIQPGDAVVVTGALGDHSIHLLSLRAGLGYERDVLSDCAPLNHLVRETVSFFGNRTIRCCRDVTRGGLATVLHEIAHDIGGRIRLDQDRIPIQPATRMAADMLGVDPMHLTNEGCLVFFCTTQRADDVASFIRGQRYGTFAAYIGVVEDVGGIAEVIATSDGLSTAIEPMLGAQLPRLC